MTTWSLTPFNNELDILEIRLAELDDVVDVFVISEATQTHSGEPKQLVLRENFSRFERWQDKIRVVTVVFPPLRGNWDRENYQRNQLAFGISGMKPDDLVLLSDLDEIPRSTLVRGMKSNTHTLPVAFSVPIYTYKLNWRWPTLEDGFSHIRFFYGSSLVHHSVQEMFEMRMPSVVGDYGWHFSYIGDEDQIADKISALADEWIKEDPSWRERDHIRLSLETGVDVFGRGARNAIRAEETVMPRYVQENRERFEHLLVHA